MNIQRIVKGCFLLLGIMLALESDGMYSYELFTSITNEFGLIDAGKAAAFRSAPVVPGEWNTNLDKCKAYCEETGRPMFACWGKWNCVHCAGFDELFFEESFKKFMKTPPWNEVVYVYLPGNEDSYFPESAENGAAFFWMGGNDGSRGNNWWTTDEFPGRGFIEGFPFVAFYWHANRIDWHSDAEYAVGDEDGWPADDGTPAEIRIERLIKQFEKWFAGWNGLNSNTGADALPGTGENARLEIQAGFTTFVDVPLTRTNSLDRIGTNLLCVVQGTTVDNPIVVEWPISEDGSAQTQFVRVEVPVGLKVGDELGLILQNGKGENIAESLITVVDVPNSPTNPHWLNEYSSADLPFGEWTMDLAVATNKVAQFNARRARSTDGKPALTLLLLAGGLWCPDCMKADEHLFSHLEFKRWAVENNAALVVLDIPNVYKNETNGDNPTGEGSPCLLKYETVGERSGMGYLSRHMVDPSAASELMAASLDYAARDVTQGGLRLLNATNPYRPGVPLICVLREDGTIAGRIDAFGVSGPTSFKQAYITRLDELAGMLADEHEESNRDYRTTKAVIGPREQVDAWLAHCDQIDVYKLNGAAGQYVKASIEGASIATVQLTLFSVQNGVQVPLASSATKSVREGVSLECEIPEGDVWLQVTGSGNTFNVSYDTENSSVVYYKLKTNNVLVPMPELKTYQAGPGESDVTIRFEANKRYYIEGLDAIESGVVVRDALNVYRATKSGDYTLALAQNGQLVVYSAPDESFFTASAIQFVADEYPNARLEAEIGYTSFVEVPLVRTNQTDVAAMTLLKALESDGKVVEYTLAWAAGEREKTVRVNIPESLTAGGTIMLETYTGAGQKIAVSSIAGVEPKENSSTNPYWFKERTASTLKWGEWSMDLDAVTNKVAANPGAYAIAVVQGCLWCPNCWKMESNLWDREEVRAWASRNKVVFGVVDIVRPDEEAVKPFSYELASPTLLKYESFNVTWEQGAEGENWKSGAGYLSRHMAEGEDIAKCKQRNEQLVNSSTLENGWCRPERAQNPWRTGLPMILLVRGDGSIAGRLDEFNWSGPESYGDYLLTRLDELLALAEDSQEEDNNDWQTTKAVIQADDTVSGTINAMDRLDVYKVNGNNLELHAKVLGTGAATVRLQLVQTEVDDAGERKETVRAEQYGNLVEGIELNYEIQTNAAFYLVVQGSARGEDDKVVEFWNDASSVRTYSLITSSILLPAGDRTEHHAAADATTVRVSVKAGTVYYFEGLGALTETVAAVLVKSDKAGEENLYYAKEDAVLDLPLSTTGGSITYCVFESGSFGFTETTMKVVEGSNGEKQQRVEFKVFREGSAFGPASLLVQLDDQSTCESERFEWEDQVVTWESGEAGEKTVSFVLKNDEFYDAPIQHLVFKVVSAGSGEIEIARDRGVLTVSIVEDDSIQVGKLAFTAANPTFARTMTIFAEEETEVAFEVTREGGVSGEVSAYLQMAGNGIETVRGDVLTWENRTRVAWRESILKMPSYEEVKKVAVTIIPAGIETVAARRAVTVYIVPHGAPKFEQSSLTRTAYLHTKISEYVEIGNLADSGEVNVAKISGALPTGVTASYMDGALFLSGIPTRTGEFTASFRVSQLQGGELIEGSSITVTFLIQAIPVATGKDESNPYLARSRNFRNIPVTSKDTGSGGTVKGRLTGLLTLTVPTTGRLSAKYTSAEGVYSFSTRGWDSYVDGTATAVLGCTRSGLTNLVLTVVSRPDGTVGISLPAPTSALREFVGGDVLTAEATETIWGRTAEESAEAYQGVYNVQLPQDAREGWSLPLTTGDAGLSLRMTGLQSTYGRMTYAGYLPNGRTVSGSAELISAEDGVKMPFFVRSSSDILAGVFRLDPNALREQSSGLEIWNRYVFADPEAWPYWMHVESGLEQVLMASLTVNGGLYLVPKVYSECNRLFSGDILGLVFPDKVAVSASAGSSSPLSTVNLEVKTDSSINLLAGTLNPNVVRFAFSPETGCYSGTFTLTFPDGNKRSVGSYRGLVVPGWGGCETCGRLLPGPFGGGAFWFSDSIGGVSVKCGAPVRVNKQDE